MAGFADAHVDARDGPNRGLTARVTDVASRRPFLSAVNWAETYLKARTTPNPKYILLATDGIPLPHSSLMPA
jgi:hypothetical protein